MKPSISLLCTLFLSILAIAQNNPIPFIDQPLVPSAAAPGGKNFTITVNGAGFVSGSVVNWSGTPLDTTFVSSAELTATVAASNIATAHTASVTVANPAPGGGMSNVAYLQITNPESSVALAQAGSRTSGYLGSVAADFNGDGKLDLAIATEAQVPTSLKVLIGNGDGTFQAPAFYPLLDSGGVSFAGDFNGDGKLDVVTGTSLLLGNGDGTFQPAITLPLFVAAIGDFNNDGKLDLAGLGGAGGTEPLAFVALGNGDGTFQPITGVGVCGSMTGSGVAVADFNGDGNLDLIYSDTYQLNGNIYDQPMCLFLGNGDGTFTPGTSPGYATDFVVADFNGDGRQDVLSYSGLLNQTLLALGNGDGTFQPQTPVKNCTLPLCYPTLTGDFNGDGKLDFATTDGKIVLGNGDGTFQFPMTYSVPEIGLTGTGDFNGDGRLDLNSGSYIELQQQSGTVDFSLTPSPASRTVSPGQTADYIINISALNGFNQTIELSCSGAPSGATCTMTPDSVTPNLNGSGTPGAELTVVTTGPSTGFARPLSRATSREMFAGWFVFPCMLGLCAPIGVGVGGRELRSRRIAAMTLLCCFAIAVYAPGCGGGSGGESSSGSGGTPAGTYTLTVTGTYGAGSPQVSHSVNVTLTVD